MPGEKRSYSRRLWLEEEIEDDLKWCFIVKEVLHSGVSQYQDVELVETGPFGKVLLLDGKMQSAEADEVVYHECLCHPALLHHPNPKTVFVMGGGEGSTVREILRHKTVEKVVMCDIDEVVVDFCRKHLTMNSEAFADPRLELIINDAKVELDKSGTYDVIIGDLADPVYGGPCYQLYTEEFYENVVKKHLNPGGIFITQSGPCGVLSHTQVFTPIAKTVERVFKNVTSYGVHVPSFSDAWGYNMGFLDGSMKVLSAEELEKRAQERISSELKFLDGETWAGVKGLNKMVRKSLAEETRYYNKDANFFIHGEGVAE